MALPSFTFKELKHRRCTVCSSGRHSYKISGNYCGFFFRVTLNYLNKTENREPPPQKLNEAIDHPYKGYRRYEESPVLATSHTLSSVQATTCLHGAPKNAKGCQEKCPHGQHALEGSMGNAEAVEPSRTLQGITLTSDRPTVMQHGRKPYHRHSTVFQPATRWTITQPTGDSHWKRQKQSSRIHIKWMVHNTRMILSLWPYGLYNGTKLGIRPLRP